MWETFTVAGVSVLMGNDTPPNCTQLGERCTIGMAVDRVDRHRTEHRYTPRILLALRFRSPIIPIPIAPAERLYSRLALWTLARQRGACPDSCAQMYLEDATQAEIDDTKIL
ncbi:unnamed protein product [Arctia plantaginis]|uniref:Uncharacterized protein n=1 Tax=Arctia plantaginis TaxID=874455 RepID=A0A8S0ZHG3_ARCPL|nr:unnamed protein product [Arctia plantaginis]